MLPEITGTLPNFSELPPPEALTGKHQEKKTVILSSQTTAKAVDECTQLTLNSIKVLSPEYSSFIQGIKLICTKDTGYLPISGGLGVLLIMATPVWEPLRVVGAAIGALAGSIGTLFTGIFYGAQRAGELTAQAMEPTEAELERLKFTSAFVERMQAILTNQEINFPRPHVLHFYEHPEQLIGLAALAVAFRSRDLAGTQLRTTYGVIDEAFAKKQPLICQNYFNFVYEMKEAIRGLRLSPDNVLAWDFMVKAYTNVSEGAIAEYEGNQMENLNYVALQAKELCSLFIKDPIFQKLWSDMKP